MQMLPDPPAQHTAVGQPTLGGIAGKGRETPLHSMILHSRVLNAFLTCLKDGIDRQDSHVREFVSFILKRSIT